MVRNILKAVDIKGHLCERTRGERERERERLFKVMDYLPCAVADLVLEKSPHTKHYPANNVSHPLPAVIITTVTAI